MISLIDDKTAKVQLTRGLFSLIDIEDIDTVSGYKWHALAKRKGGKFYANSSIHVQGSGKNRVKFNITMHRLILGFTHSLHVDHINGDTLDNRKSNLRFATNSQNHMNIGKMKKETSSKYKGVSLRGSRWRATIRANGKAKELGSFNTEEEAAKAYNEAALYYFGTFSKLNEIP